MAVRVPAFCPSCGGIFPSPIALGPGSGATFKNVVVNCPFCGGTAEIEGEFVGAENAIQVLKSKFITPENLRAFAKILRDAYEKKTPIEEVKRRANEIDPTLGDAVERIGRNGAKLWTASLLILMLSLSRCNFDVKMSLDVNDIVKQMTTKPPAEITRQIDSASNKHPDDAEK